MKEVAEDGRWLNNLILSMMAWLRNFWNDAQRTRRVHRMKLQNYSKEPTIPKKQKYVVIKRWVCFPESKSQNSCSFRANIFYILYLGQKFGSSPIFKGTKDSSNQSFLLVNTKLIFLRELNIWKRFCLPAVLDGLIQTEAPNLLLSSFNIFHFP